MNLYAQNILDHYKNPRNAGTLEKPSARRREANYSCGDIAEIDIFVENNILKELKSRGEGCAISQAARSILGENILNMPVDTILSLHEKDVVAMLGVPISQRRKKCALLALLAVHNALYSLKGLTIRQWSDIISGEW